MLVQDSRENAEDLEMGKNDLWVARVARSSSLSPPFMVFEVFCTLGCRK